MSAEGGNPSSETIVRSIIWLQLGDNCIQKFLGEVHRWICTVGNLVLRRRARGAVNWISERISADLPPQM